MLARTGRGGFEAYADIPSCAPTASMGSGRTEGAHIGRKSWRHLMTGGKCVRKTAAKFEVNPSTVQRIARPFGGAEDASVAA
jgi:hypothetical protein